MATRLPLDADLVGSETPFPFNKAMASVYRQGRQAARNGLDMRACPYHRREQFTYRGGVTFSRAFIRAWGEGWHAEHGRSWCRLFPIHDGECERRP